MEASRRRDHMKYLCCVCIILGLTVPGHAGELFDASNLPAQVSEFYRDYNFIGSFSTTAERWELMRYLDSPALPPHIQSKRLDKIFSLMKKVLFQIYRSDHAMEIFPGRLTRRSFFPFKSEVVEVEDVNPSLHKMAVKVKALPLEAFVVEKWIKEYENRENLREITLSFDDRIKGIGGLLSSHEAVHHWIHQEDRWMKLEINLLYLDFNKK